MIFGKTTTPEPGLTGTPNRWPRSRDARPGLRRGLFELLRHAEKAAADYSLDTRAILVELGRRKMVGGQEDKIGPSERRVV